MDFHLSNGVPWMTSGEFWPASCSEGIYISLQTSTSISRNQIMYDSINVIGSKDLRKGINLSSGITSMNTK